MRAFFVKYYDVRSFAQPEVVVPDLSFGTCSVAIAARIDAA